MRYISYKKSPGEKRSPGQKFTFWLQPEYQINWHTDGPDKMSFPIGLTGKRQGNGSQKRAKKCWLRR